MIRKYHMVLHSPMGPREGALTLDECQGQVAGTLRILSHEVPVHGRRDADGRLCLTHPIITAVSEYPCQTVLRDEGGALSGELRMDQSGAPWGRSRYRSHTVMPWSGEPMDEKEAECN